MVYAEAPTPRPLLPCKFQPGDVVYLDWFWVIIADGMGFAHQGPLPTWEQDDKEDYGVWACIFPEAILDAPCAKYQSNGDPDLACFKYHETLKEFHFWRWNFADSKYSPQQSREYTPAQRAAVQNLRPTWCNFTEGEVIDVTLEQIQHLSSTHRAFQGPLPFQHQLPNMTRWACMGPYMVSVLHNRISPVKNREKTRPCVKWSPDLSTHAFSYDLLCMKFNDTSRQFSFWGWNSEREDTGRVGYSKAYSQATFLADPRDTSTKRRGF